MERNMYIAISLVTRKQRLLTHLTFFDTVPSGFSSSTCLQPQQPIKKSTYYTLPPFLIICLFLSIP